MIRMFLNTETIDSFHTYRNKQKTVKQAENAEITKVKQQNRIKSLTQKM